MGGGWWWWSRGDGGPPNKRPEMMRLIMATKASNRAAVHGVKPPIPDIIDARGFSLPRLLFFLFWVLPYFDYAIFFEHMDFSIPYFGLFG